jgi:hypothetical protein
MKKREQNQRKRQPHRVRLPGFLIEEEIGLGDAIKRVTYAMGINPCSGCEKRGLEKVRGQEGCGAQPMDAFLAIAAAPSNANSYGH